jgi:hypothetical protein
VTIYYQNILRVCFGNSGIKKIKTQNSKICGKLQIKPEF